MNPRLQRFSLFLGLSLLGLGPQLCLSTETETFKQELIAQFEHLPQELKSYCRDFASLDAQGRNEKGLESLQTEKKISRLKEAYGRFLRSELDAKEISPVFEGTVKTANEIMRTCELGEIQLSPEGMAYVASPKERELVDRSKTYKEILRTVGLLDRLLLDSSGVQAPAQRVDELLIQINQLMGKYRFKGLGQEFWFKQSLSRISQQMLLQLDRSGVTYEEGQLRSLPLENPPPKGALSQKIKDVLKGLLKAEKEKKAEFLQESVKKLNDFLSVYPFYGGILQTVFSSCPYLKLNSKQEFMVDDDGSMLTEDGLQSSFNKATLMFPVDQELKTLDESYSFLGGLVMAKSQALGHVGMAERLCQAFTSIVKDDDHLNQQVVSEYTFPYFSLFKKSLHLPFADDGDKEFFANTLNKVNATLAGCQLGTFEPKGDGLVFVGSEKEKELLENAKTINALSVIFGHMANLEEGEESKAIIEQKILKANEVIAANKAGHLLQKKTLSKLIREFNRNSKVRFNVSGLEVSADSKLQILPMKNPAPLNEVKAAIHSFYGDLMEFEEKKDETIGNRVLEKFHSFRLKYPEYFGPFKNTLKRNSLVALTAEGDLKLNPHYSKVNVLSLLKSLKMWSDLYPQDQDLSTLYDYYAQRVLIQNKTDENGDGVDDADQPRLTIETIKPLSLEEVSAIGVFTDTDGCAAMNLQTQMGFFPLESAESLTGLSHLLLDDLVAPIKFKDKSMKLSESLKVATELAEKSGKVYLEKAKQLDPKFPEGQSPPETKDILDYFDSALQKIPNTQEVLYHGVPQNSPFNREDLKVGDTIKMKNYVSLSYDPYVASFFGKDSKKLISIKTKKGKSISKYSTVYVREEEFLLLPKAKVRITDLTKVKVIDFCNSTDRCKQDLAPIEETDNDEYLLITAEEL